MNAWETFKCTNVMQSNVQLDRNAVLGCAEQVGQRVGCSDLTPLANGTLASAATSAGVRRVTGAVCEGQEALGCPLGTPCSGLSRGSFSPSQE